jgi:uncharacterized membrane protein YgcG
MSYTARTRDRYRLAVAAVSGLATFGALTATGLIAGAAAQDYEAQQAKKQADDLAVKQAYRAAKKKRTALIKANKVYYARLAKQASHPRIVLRDRPLITHVTTQYVGGSGYVGSGGTVSSGSSGSWSSGSSGSSSGGSSGGSSSGGSSGGSSTPAPAPPPPPPPPAPSTGS